MNLWDFQCKRLKSEGSILPLDNSSCFNQPESNCNSIKDDLPNKPKYTPLELQFLEMKRDHPDAILFIECGYKYRIFGEDAEIASKELDLGLYMNHNFPTTSFPTHRLSVHTQRLVVKGFKVGVIKQTESSALKKAGDQKNALFSRSLHALYTQSTFVEGDLVTSQADGSSFSSLGSLVCISENCHATKSTTIGVVAVNVFSAEVLYASFEDSVSRFKLENCFFLANPVEFLLPNTLSNATENLISKFIDLKCVCGKKIRTERCEDQDFDFPTALHKMSKFWDDTKADPETFSGAFQKDLPPSVICCLSPLVSYLRKFKLELLLQNYRCFKQLDSASFRMTLNTPAVRNLELVENLSDSQEYGTLLWTVNFTVTKFGKRLLKNWLLQPLKNIQEINERQNAVTEVLNSSCAAWSIIEKLLSTLPDIERLLCAAFYHRCTQSEFISLIKGLCEIKKQFAAVSNATSQEIKNVTLKNIVLETVILMGGIEKFNDSLNVCFVRHEDPSMIFTDLSKYPDVLNCKKEIEFIEQKLHALKNKIAETLHQSSFEYCSVMGCNYLIEVKNTSLPLVPTSWIKMSCTKLVSRFRSPEVDCLCCKLQQCSEKLVLYCNEAWKSFLSEFAAYFYKYKKVISHLATIDCIFAFAKVAKQDCYCRPLLTESLHSEIDIVNGRNPIVSRFVTRNCQYVSNHTQLKASKRCMIITGPNMGGKSSYVRQVALIAVLAQAGSYVPADSASLPVFDSIFVRMGAEDNICHKQSTFFTEMQEASVILSTASSKSLVILDELGRGTSSLDGAAIAESVLHYIVTKVKCFTLFVTHYPDVSRRLQELCPDDVIACHMSFVVNTPESDVPCKNSNITFLYTLKLGIATRSYGINVARLAGLPSEILLRAQEKSEEMEKRYKLIS